MPLTAECPWCAILIKAVPDEQDGQKMDCPRCGKPFTVAGRPSSSKDKKGGPAAKPKPRSQAYPPRKELEAARAAERAEEARAERDAAPVRPVKAAVARPSEPEEEQEESVGSAIPWFVVLGVLAFLLGSVGVALASFPGMELIAVGVTLVGLVLGATGFFVAYKQDTGTLYPLLGIVVCLPAVMWSAYCYAQVPKPEKGRSASELAKKVVVPLNNRNPALSGEKPELAQEGTPVDSTKEAQKQGDLQVAVAQVSITKAPLKGAPGKKPPAEKCLIVHLRISNVGVERKYDYSGWGQWGSENAASLRDTKGKVFPLKHFNAEWDVEGQVRSTSLFPGKSIDDILIFEAPKSKEIPAHLRLELPGAAYGGTDKFLFEIPGKTINVAPDGRASGPPG